MRKLAKFLLIFIGVPAVILFVANASAWFIGEQYAKFIWAFVILTWAMIALRLAYSN